MSQASNVIEVHSQKRESVKFNNGMQTKQKLTHGVAWLLQPQRYGKNMTGTEKFENSGST